MNANQVEVGMRVTMAGFLGTVVRICEWSRHGDCVMVEVRLPGGIGCYSCTDLIPA